MYNTLSPEPDVLQQLKTSSASSSISQEQKSEAALHWAQAPENWTVEDWTNVAFSDESDLRQADGRVRIWRHSIGPTCLVSTVQAAGGVMVWGIYCWHILGPFVLLLTMCISLLPQFTIY